MAADQRLHGRAQQRVPGYQTQSSRLPFQRISDHHAVLYRRQAPLAPFLIPPKTAENQIDIVRLQAPQTVVNRMEDVLAGKATLVQVVTHYSEHLGGVDQAVARRAELLERAPQNLFAGAERIDVRRIEEGDAGLDGLTDRSEERRVG